MIKYHCWSKMFLISDDRREFSILLKIFFLEKALLDINSKINNHHPRLTIPMKGIMHVFEDNDNAE